jgi:hypothetical protein
LEAVVGVDTKLVDDLEGVFAPVLDVDEGVVERGAVVADEAVDLAEQGRGGENVGGDDLVEEALEFAVGELDAVEGLEVVAEVAFDGGSVADVGAIGVFEIGQFADQRLFELLFGHGYQLSRVLLFLTLAERFGLHGVRLRRVSAAFQRTRYGRSRKKSSQLAAIQRLL